MIKYFTKYTIIILCIFGCKVGDDDPFISFRSRKARFVNEWKTTKYTVNGSNFYPAAYTFHKDGTGVYYTGYPPEAFNLVWHFLDKSAEYKKEERVYMKLIGASLPDTWVIKKLCNKYIEMESTKLTPIGIIKQELNMKQK